MFSEGFDPIEVPTQNTGRETILFPVKNPKTGEWCFDLFSAIFYLGSRYEEYTGFEPDFHNRFPPEASILYKTESFEFPLVNIWVEKLRLDILSHWPDTKFNPPKFKFVSTIDVDSTFQYCEKGFKWTLSGILKDAIHTNFKLVFERIKTIAGVRADAFDVFDTLDALHKKYKTEVKYFFLLGDYAPFDKTSPGKTKSRHY